MGQYSNFSGVMEPETISKNGANLKSLMNKGNFFGKAFFVLFAAGILLSGCHVAGIKGDGNVESRERVVGEFSGISLDGVASVNVHPDSEYKVLVTTDRNIQEIVIVEDKNDILHIRQKDNLNVKATKLQIDIYLPKLKSIKSSGVGSINVSAGNASDLTINLSGVGSINSQDYQVENVTVSLSGVGSAKIWATNTLNGNLSGVGSVSYKGAPTINVNKSGVGSIKPL
jgi:hypothetical protein